MPKQADKYKSSWKVIENATAVDTLLGVSREVPVEKPAISVTLTSVKLQLAVDAHAVYDGLETGKRYEWARAGSIVAVDSLDAPALLEKRIKAQSCCNQSDNPVFQIVD
jgi:hypothetical protein